MSDEVLQLNEDKIIGQSLTVNDTQQVILERMLKLSGWVNQEMMIKEMGLKNTPEVVEGLTALESDGLLYSCSINGNKWYRCNADGETALREHGDIK
jgi:hypothetical protein